MQAQKLSHVQGQLLIEIDTDVNLETWTRNFNNSTGNHIEIVQKISPVLNMYVVGFDFTKYNEQEILYKLNIDRDIVAAQYNHFIEPREIPNDPDLANQWQYINIGQSGGLEGADIDMDLAWDITTGGLTADGDTIVVCIIDDGVDGTHEDLIPNLFINHAEIPDNGIDDDDNGFVDDYHGWRTSQDNDNVYSGGGHGTPVAGIVGAKGNNNLGVAGVNWDVKLMIVRGGSGLESEVLEAYSYPLVFRKKYNETNGEEGAFVVSTNASWGTDFGQPDDAPLWCAFYDTLGEHGILNCGATINANVNVDEEGDLPTACPSDYLISVTNMNKNDIKVNGAGYGSETIDLGAFGSETWTVSYGSNYSSFGGTSGATPHVAGTVALLYSLPCPTLIALAKSDPGYFAKLIKEVILDSTDPNNSLQGITVSEGRLNVRNAVDLLLTNCDDCLAPVVEDITYSENNQTKIQWTTNDTIVGINLRYKKTSDSEWILVENVVSPYTIESLDLCTEYQLQLQATCENSSGNFLLTNNFKTEGCCINPQNIEYQSISIDESSISWSPVPAATSYNIRYKKITESIWNEKVSPSNVYSFSNLDPCEFYEFQIQSVCTLPSPDYAVSFIFNTLNCELPCAQLPYCTIDGYRSNDEWVSSVKIDSDEYSSASDNGYGMHIDAPVDFNLMRNGIHSMTISPGFSDTKYNENFGVWIDFNQDGLFEDENELVFLRIGQNEPVTSEILIPEDATLGSTRMRIVMIYEKNPESCTSDDFDEFGEVEDYCVNINKYECPVIDGLKVSNIEETSAKLNWNINLNHDDYIVEFKEVSSSTWTVIQPDSSSSHLLSDLEECVTYEVRISTKCSVNSLEQFSEILEFKSSCSSNLIENQILGIESVYPNPFTDNLKIGLTENYTFENLDIDIIDYTGKSLISIQTGKIQSDFTIKTNQLIPGMYILRLKSAESIIYTQKIIKL